MRNAEGRGEWIFGRRPVAEVLRAGRRKVYEAALPQPFRGTGGELDEILSLLNTGGIAVRRMPREQLDRICDGGNHQSIALRTSPYPYVDLEDLLAAGEGAKDPLYLLLDHLEDPQNVGSLLRTADAAGVTGVILPEDRASGVTPAAVRASAGASEHLRIARVVNLPRAMQALQKNGVWLTGLDMPGKDTKPYTEIDFRGAAGLVVGAEGDGLSRLVRQTCDFIASLPMRGGVASLNAAVAGAVALYEILRQRA
ncbi:MAG: 23S rRNA (guanosine(2251)-2'-O)-methyltransferase RlmB [Kiritimatiellae bacterium]|nr:23S rRNA (guanosine(2251)-2'-O)-methyltransferase RlmB [Kiritimatiellia bacterium]